MAQALLDNKEEEKDIIETPQGPTTRTQSLTGDKINATRYAREINPKRRGTPQSEDKVYLLQAYLPETLQAYQIAKGTSDNEETRYKIWNDIHGKLSVFDKFPPHSPPLQFPQWVATASGNYFAALKKKYVDSCRSRVFFFFYIFAKFRMLFFFFFIYLRKIVFF